MPSQELGLLDGFEPDEVGGRTIHLSVITEVGRSVGNYRPAFGALLIPSISMSRCCPDKERRLPGAVRWQAMTRIDRITSDPGICHGQPTIRGLRYPVENLLELLAGGMTIEEIIEDHPDLERDDLLAALEFGALASGQRRVVPLGAA